MREINQIDETRLSQKEKAVLYATHLNIGTVWLGGTFKRSNFASQLKIASDENAWFVVRVGFFKLS